MVLICWIKICKSIQFCARHKITYQGIHICLHECIHSAGLLHLKQYIYDRGDQSHVPKGLTHKITNFIISVCPTNSIAKIARSYNFYRQNLMLVLMLLLPAFDLDIAATRGIKNFFLMPELE